MKKLFIIAGATSVLLFAGYQIILLHGKSDPPQSAIAKELDNNVSSSIGVLSTNASTSVFRPKGDNMPPEKIAKIKREVADILASDKAKYFTLYKPPQFPGDQELDRMLTSIRRTTYSSTLRKVPRDPCASGTAEILKDKTSTFSPAPGLYFSLRTSKHGEPIEGFEVQAFDADGGHIGPVESDPSSPWYPLALPEERSRYWDFRGYGAVSMFSLDQMVDTKLVFKGRRYDLFPDIELRGEGNGCGITNSIDIPMTPYSTVTLPITKKGDIGPMLYDINGDGKSDFEISLVYEMSSEQKILLYKIINQLSKIDGVDLTRLD